MGTLVTLNVGGLCFSTTVETLMAEPQSKLAVMFRNVKDLPHDERGRVFIDRDGPAFAHILNYLRDPPSFNICIFTYKEILMIKREAAYFQLNELLRRLPGEGPLLPEAASTNFTPTQASSESVRIFRENNFRELQLIKNYVRVETTKAAKEGKRELVAYFPKKWDISSPDVYLLAIQDLVAEGYAIKHATDSGYYYFTVDIWALEKYHKPVAQAGDKLDAIIRMLEEASVMQYGQRKWHRA
eukprot:GCRY01002526.1.p1 GENE.GCRY01002526.1~~GCRY01002526.1.p1  ORF type:complete len:242 (+),score=30.67 GCRY01002526.1:226-951(+)